MALSSYAELKDEIQSWAHRTDTEMVSRIDTFILLAEKEMWSRLQIRDMEDLSSSSLSTSSRYLALPSAFIAMRSINLVSGSKYYDLDSALPSNLRITDGAGIPSHYCITSQIEFDRIPSSAFTAEIRYFKSLTGLSSSNTTNSVLTRFPLIYLYGCLKYYGAWAQDLDFHNAYAALFSAAIDDANTQDMKGRKGAAPRMQIRGSTP